ncbi:MAG: hypothetical protein ACPGVB_13715 [Chitinophagales bacterium]
MKEEEKDSLQPTRRGELPNGVLSEKEALQQGLDKSTTGRFIDFSEAAKGIAAQFQVSESDPRIQYYLERLDKLLHLKNELDRNLLSGDFSSSEEAAAAYNKLFQEISNLNLLFTDSPPNDKKSKPKPEKIDLIADPDLIDLDEYKKLGDELNL